MPIQRLSEECLNRIAAGEVLVRPLNAVKELLENSIDAESTDISIVIGNGGMQTIQVADNGVGIPVSDHPLVCERFATSKLVGFEDLTNGTLSSFGFRGEALASMSLVGHVSIFSKREEDPGGWESRYLRGILLPNFPAPYPIVDHGTRVVVDDLFYDHPVKKRTFKKSEYRKILQLVTDFIIAYPQVRFRIKQLGDVTWDIESPKGQNRIDHISSILNIPKPSLSHLKENEFECIFSNSAPSTMIFLVNDRLVDMFNWKDKLSSMITGFLFLSLTISPNEIDVNVNPTKREVVFENQSELLKIVMEKIGIGIRDSTKSFEIKLKPILFGSSSTDTSRPYRIHTCPTQVAFSRPEKELEEAPLVKPFLSPAGQPFIPTAREPFMSTAEDLFSSEQPMKRIKEIKEENTQKPMLELSQRGSDNRLLCFTQKGSTRFLSQSSQQSMELSQSCEPVNQIGCIQKELLAQYHSIEDISSLTQLMATLVFVGIANKEYVICQSNQFLCICNIVEISRFVLNFFFLQKILFVELDNDWSETVDHLLDGVEDQRNDQQDDQKMSCENLRRKIEQKTDLFLEKFNGKLERIFNEVIKNKTLYLLASPGSRVSSINNKFCKEIISLKELYREFERC